MCWALGTQDQVRETDLKGERLKVGDPPPPSALIRFWVRVGVDELELSSRLSKLTSFLGGVSVQFSCSVMSNSLWPHGLQHARLPCPSPTPGACSNSCPSIDAIQPSHPLSSPSPPAFNLSQHQGLFRWVSSLHQMAKVLELQLQHQLFQYSGLISLRFDWLDLLAVHGNLKSLLQHHSSKASILWHSAFFRVQL